jgi:predicted house-cleaning noncanonical NTP pyrophosphatase (MazG superfamily)
MEAKMARRKLTDALIAEIARQFSTISEFQKADPSAYKAARERGILTSVCEHMKRSHRSFTVQSLTDIALKYDSKTAFKKADSSAYNAALNLGIVSEICMHMEKIYGKWTKDIIVELAKNFDTRRSFQLAHPGAYATAQKMKCIEEICNHMQAPPRTLGRTTVLHIARGFKTRREFAIHDASAYGKALSNGWSECFKHMERGYSGFKDDKKAILYQIQFTLPFGKKVWKVGITNRSVSTRIKCMGINDWVRYQVTHEVAYEKGSDARAEENRLHKLGDSLGLSYTGDPFLGNGNTELFSAPLLD